VLGHNTDAYANAVGLSVDGPRDPFATVPAGVFGRLWRLAFETDPSPHLPVLVGSSIPYGAFGLLDYLVGSAETLGDGLVALAHYFRLAAMTARLEIRTSDPHSVWIRNEPPSPTDMVSDAFTLSVIASRFGTRTPSGRPREVHLTQPVGPPIEPFERALGCPVILGRKRAGLRYLGETWNQPLSGAEPSLHATLRDLAERTDVKRYVSGPVSYAIRLRLPEQLKSGSATVDSFAGLLNMSQRTLQRRLANEGTSFEVLLDEFRKEEAARLLADPERSVSDVGRDLGYREAGSFTRAFRRWYGMAPSKWRRKQ
jgi:AraC-like DNA-binding protein